MTSLKFRQTKATSRLFPYLKGFLEFFFLSPEGHQVRQGFVPEETQGRLYTGLAKLLINIL